MSIDTTRVSVVPPTSFPTIEKPKELEEKNKVPAGGVPVTPALVNPVTENKVDEPVVKNDVNSSLGNTMDFAPKSLSFTPSATGLGKDLSLSLSSPKTEFSLLKPDFSPATSTFAGMCPMPMPPLSLIPPTVDFGFYPSFLSSVNNDPAKFDASFKSTKESCPAIANDLDKGMESFYELGTQTKTIDTKSKALEEAKIKNDPVLLASTQKEYDDSVNTFQSFVTTKKPFDWFNLSFLSSSVAKEAPPAQVVAIHEKVKEGLESGKKFETAVSDLDTVTDAKTSSSSNISDSASGSAPAAPPTLAPVTTGIAKGILAAGKPMNDAIQKERAVILSANEILENIDNKDIKEVATEAISKLGLNIDPSKISKPELVELLHDKIHTSDDNSQTIFNTSRKLSHGMVGSMVLAVKADERILANTAQGTDVGSTIGKIALRTQIIEDQEMAANPDNILVAMKSLNDTSTKIETDPAKIIERTNSEKTSYQSVLSVANDPNHSKKDLMTAILKLPNFNNITSLSDSQIQEVLTAIPERMKTITSIQQAIANSINESDANKGKPKVTIDTLDSQGSDLIEVPAGAPKKVFDNISKIDNEVNPPGQTRGKIKLSNSEERALANAFLAEQFKANGTPFAQPQTIGQVLADMFDPNKQAAFVNKILADIESENSEDAVEEAVEEQKKAKKEEDKLRAADNVVEEPISSDPEYSSAVDTTRKADGSVGAVNTALPLLAKLKAIIVKLDQDLGVIKKTTAKKKNIDVVGMNKKDDIEKWLKVLDNSREILANSTKKLLSDAAVQIRKEK
ncbi:MAG: hypothetical protein AABZ74_14380 [Cyanobacteriota bacterium]